MDTKLLGLILQGDKKNEREFNRLKKTYEEMSSSKAHVITNSANGESIVISDSSDSKLDNLRVLGKSEQFSTTGAQLLKYPFIHSSMLEQGITWTDNGDGSISMKGTASTDSFFGVYRNIDGERGFLEAGTYTLSAAFANNDYFVNFATVKDGVETSYNINYDNPKNIFTIDVDKDFFLFVIVRSGRTVDDTIRVMLNEGETALPWEPYTGGIPSPNPQYPQEIASAGDDGNVEANVYGGNLLDITKFSRISTNTSFTESGITFANVNDDYITVIGTATSYAGISQYLDLPKGVYVLSGCNYSSKLLLRARIKKDETSFVDYGCGVPFEITDDVVKLQIMIQADPNWTVDTVVKPMLNKGAVPLPYKPYTRQPLTIQTPNGLPGIKVTDSSIATYTDEAGQMWCADEVDFERGVYVKRIGKVDITRDRYKRHDFYETYNKFSFGTDILYDTDNYTSRTLPTLSNKFVANPRNIIGCFDSLTISDGGWQGYVRSIFVVDKSVASLDDFMNYVGDECFVMIPLKEPIETPLSETELAQYKALHTNYPTTTILNDSGAHMEVKYTADKKNYIDNKFAQITNAVLSMGSNV